MTASILSPRFRLLVRLSCALMVLCPVLASADVTTTPGGKKKKKDDGGYVPEAKPLNVRFIGGMPVDIELDAATASTGSVRFVIREMPQHGTLSAIRPHPRESYKAIVTYTPKPGDDALADRFTYACKLEEGSWSAPSAVNLTGKRANPKVEIMQTPSFGRVLPGAEATAKMVLKNTGIAPFAADMQWQAPWLGPPRIELGIGEEKEFLLSVKPTAPGTLIWEAELQPGEALSKVRLYVECMQLFVVAPGQLKLNYAPATSDRRGKVGVANSTDQPMKFIIEPPDRLKAPREIEVPSKQSLDVEVSLSPDDVKAFRGELWVIHEPYRDRVLIEAAPEPPQIMLAAPKTGAVDFGTQQKGKNAQSKILLQNIGGEAAVLAAQAAPPFRVVESDAAVSIAPGESREMTVEAVSGQAGKFTGDIILSGTGGKLSVAARLTVTDPSTPQPIRPMTGPNARSARVPVAKSGPAVPVAASSKPEVTTPKDGEPKARKEEAKPEPAVEGQLPSLSPKAAAVYGYVSAFGFPILKTMMNPKLRKVDGIEVVKQGRDDLVLAWKESDGDDLKPERYRLEHARSFQERQTQRWLKTWSEMPGVETIKGEAGRQTVRVTGLVPDSRYELRVLAVDADGRVSEPSDIHFISTAPPFRLPWWTWQALIVLALGIFGFIYFRISRGKWDI